MTTTPVRSRRRRAPIALAPVTDKVYRQSFRTGAVELVGARTADGVWDIERSEDAASTWLLFHRASVADGSWAMPAVTFGTLRACRAHIASGGADEELALRKAEL